MEITSSNLKSWRTSPLGSEVTLRNGSAFNAENWKSSGLPIVRIQNLKDPTAPFNFYDGPIDSRVVLRNGDLLFSWSGSKGTSFGPHIWWGAKAVLNQHIFRVDLRADSKVTKQFLYFALLHLTATIESHAYGLAALVHVRKGDLENTAIPVPPLHEQRQIAAVLSAVQRAIERQERLIAITVELKKALMHKLFIEGTRGEPLKQTEIGPVPESWDVVEFEAFSVLQRGQDLPKSEFKNGSVPVIGATTTIGFHDTANVRGPGVTVVRSGSSAGKALYIPSDFWAHNVVLYVKNFRGNHPRFVYYKLCSLDLTRFKAGVAVPTLNRNAFRTIKVAVPKVAEQIEIASALDAVEKRMKAADRTRSALSDMFCALLHQLMTAGIRVHDVDLSALEPEEAAQEPAGAV